MIGCRRLAVVNHPHKGSSLSLLQPGLTSLSEHTTAGLEAPWIQWGVTLQADYQQSDLTS